jgi:hypothetical protein
MPLSKGSIRKPRNKKHTTTSIMRGGGWPFSGRTSKATTPTTSPAPVEDSAKKIVWTPEEQKYFEQAKQERQRIDELRHTRNDELVKLFTELILIVTTEKYTMYDGTIYIDDDDDLKRIKEIMHESSEITKKFNEEKEKYNLA